MGKFVFEKNKLVSHVDRKVVRKLVAESQGEFIPIHIRKHRFHRFVRLGRCVEEIAKFQSETVKSILSSNPDQKSIFPIRRLRKRV